MLTYVAVNTDALLHNLQQCLQHLRPPAKLMAVVKSNAYGHGLVESARVFANAGAAWLGVATVEEGVALREAGLETPVLVFLPPLPEQHETLVRHRLTPTLLTVAQVKGLAQTAEKLEKSVTCQIYVDTGLGRLGSDDSLPDLMGAMTVFPQLHLVGVYTHFGPPGSGRLLAEIDEIREGASTRAFAGLARETFARAGIQPPLLHVAASEMFIQEPDSHLDMVRLGTLLYGQYPDHVRQRPLALRDDTFSLRSHIVALQTLPEGSRVGYGGEFVCKRATRVATVPVGLSLGLGMVPQSLLSRWRPALKAFVGSTALGRRCAPAAVPVARLAASPDWQAPIIGRISMDQCCLDVTDLPQAQIGDQVILPVRRLAVDSSVPRVCVTD